MKIIFKSTFNQEETELETESTTLGALLDELSSKYRTTQVEFFDSETREVYPDWQVFLNGQPYGALADGLDTKLKDNDKVELFVFTMAGG